ncbi:hypothetical protein LDL08_32935 [Nonomuraea glycinis]|uniref:Uncharacterized protein n=1 Tax=Nonomuraea glycinis TaxID=2047744 RepID=A0A918E8Z5_9ACTN|nr:hypothetical protein [Nonomuraea glycinis]MCA2180997.1 hypothetical protein [Nonomuraea glycinis]GGP13179.1 hypothetical protein GCM10012278_63930 [Nonomuraea glycinis]
MGRILGHLGFLLDSRHAGVQVSDLAGDLHGLQRVREEQPGFDGQDLQGAAFLAAVAALTAATVAASGSNLCTARKASDFSGSLSLFRSLDTKHRI